MSTFEILCRRQARVIDLGLHPRRQAAALRAFAYRLEKARKEFVEDYLRTLKAPPKEELS